MLGVTFDHASSFGLHIANITVVPCFCQNGGTWRFGVDSWPKGLGIRLSAMKMEVELAKRKEKAVHLCGDVVTPKLVEPAADVL